METKKTKILAIVALVALALTVVTATYAYFQAQVGDPAAVDISVNANTVDTFTFSVGDPISFSLNQENFGTGDGNQTGSTTASVKLTANNNTNTVTENYYLYLLIEENTFTYTMDDMFPDTTMHIYPEIMLTVTDASGDIITKIPGFDGQKTTGADGEGVTGFDITNKSGLIKILSNREITTTSSKEEVWNITITFVNYDKDQSANAGKSMNAKVIIQKGPIPLHETCNDNTLACRIAKTYTGTQGENNIYFHGGTLENGLNDGSYRYAGGDYQLTSKATDAGLTALYGNDGTATNGVVNLYCNDSKMSGGYICPSGYTQYYTLQYDTSNTQYSTYKEAVEKAISDGYLEFGVKNYVCFGSDEATCPTDNLYRIIGVFDNQVKLIKADYATSTQLGGSGAYSQTYQTLASFGNTIYTYFGSLSSFDVYSWNTGNTIIWSESDLNTTNLNTDFTSYLDNIDTKWTDMIAEATWKVGGNKRVALLNVIPSVAYVNEITHSDQIEDNEATEYPAKIGLMYVSDYGFAASPTAWSTNLMRYMTYRSVNWMYLGIPEWTISRVTAFSAPSACILDPLGRITNQSVAYSIAVRPTFYLTSDVTYSSGTGTASDPIRLGV